MHLPLTHFWITLTFTLLAVILLTTAQSTSAVQKFRVTPHDVQILEGTDTLLRCEVANRAGQVQWTKDGFALGFSAVIHGFPRYSVLVDAVNGIYNLQIKNASLEDDAEYQCQVGPAPGNPAIRANAKLSIVAAPSSIAIDGYAPNAKIEVVERQNLTLKCIAENANPAANLVWHSNNVPLMGVKPHVEITESAAKRYTTISTITIQPKADDDYKDFACEAKHKALPPDVPMRSSIQLSVLYPPGPPFFEGYTQGETLRRGQNVKIACRSRGGNPPAQLVWYKNGEPISSPQRTSGRLSENVYSFVADASDNGANLVCEAKNILSNTAFKAELNLTVLFAPKEVTISGATEAKVGDVVQLNCVTSPSNPPARISWSLNGRPLSNSTYKTQKSVEGGWFSSSNVSINIDANSRTFVAVCHALNVELTQNVVGSHSVSVLFPPETVKISVEPKNLVPGIRARLICDSSSSNPPAKVSWWKDGIPVEGVNLSTKPGLWGGSVSTLEVYVNITQDLDGIIYTCQSINEVLQRSVHETVSLDILYPPKFDNPQMISYMGVEGEPMRIELHATGNPMTMSYTWTKDGLPIMNNAQGQRIISDGSTLNINKLSRNDAGSYICEAMNSQGTAIMEIQILVEYPASIESVSESSSFVEGEDAVLACNILARPLAAEHITWIRAGYDMSQRTTITYDNGTSYLHITNVQRSDIGNFTCVVDNQRGAPAQRDVLLVVQSAPELDHSPAFTRFAARMGDRGRIVCRAIAAPQPSFVWRRNGKDLKMRRNKFKALDRKINALTYESSLIIENTSADDYGQYECVARNSHGQASSTLEFSKPMRPDTPLDLQVNNVTENGVDLAWTPGFDGGLPVYYRLRFKIFNEDKYKYVDAKPGSVNITIDGLKAGSTYVFSVMAANEAGGSKFLPDIKLTLTKGSQPYSAELNEKDEMPNMMIIGITSAAMVLLVLNAALVAWFVIRRQNKNSTETEAPNDDAYSKEDNQSVYKLPISALQADVQKQATSTYLVENVDIIQSTAYPPKYQESSMCSPPYMCNPDFTRTLPNPKRHSNRSGMLEPSRSKDDHMLMSNGMYIPSPSPASSLVIKGSYISSPSPAPPPDGSYFNMSDKYISYPPVAY
ncbi:hibris isoform 4-T4 [Cochliomyia hominivorax]